jgi:hypothetical protein
MIPSSYVTPLTIGAPHSSQIIIICPSGDAKSTTTTIAIHFEVQLTK